MHATLVLFQATTLNVAFNSHNKVLLTVMMANNFVEIKGTVFKKFDKNNLFQVRCFQVVVAQCLDEYLMCYFSYTLNIHELTSVHTNAQLMSTIPLK